MLAYHGAYGKDRELQVRQAACETLVRTKISKQCALGFRTFLLIFIVGALVWKLQEIAFFFLFLGYIAYGLVMHAVPVRFPMFVIRTFPFVTLQRRRPHRQIRPRHAASVD